MKFVHTADTHLGFDIVKTASPDIRGRERWASAISTNFLRVIHHAQDQGVDLLIHSGDLFNKHYLPEKTLHGLVTPLVDLARQGIPVVIIPGNHERSEFPFDLFHGARGVFVFDRPKTVSLLLGGYTVGIAGFPFIRENVRDSFLAALKETEWEEVNTDLALLATHQTFDGASVENYVFRAGRRDAVLREDLPLSFHYIAAGHIHRHQILYHPLQPGLCIAYPGSTQRMSFAEKDEEKGFIEGETANNHIETRFIPLPSCPMERVDLEASGLTASQCEDLIRSQFWRLEKDMIIRFNLMGGNSSRDYPDLDFQHLREEMPEVIQCQFAIRAGRRWIHR